MISFSKKYRFFGVTKRGLDFLGEEDDKISEIGKLNFVNSVHILGEFWLNYINGEPRKHRTHSNFFRNFTDLGLVVRVVVTSKRENGYQLTELGEAELEKLGVKLPPTEKKKPMKMYPKRTTRHKIKTKNL
jgi:hypothetical protein